FYTRITERRDPDAIYKIDVPNDSLFDIAAKPEQKRPFWTWNASGKYEKNCTVGAYSSLSSGGVNIPLSSILSLSPNDFWDGLKNWKKMEIVVLS
ncbi:hypothetical protein KUD64_004907, partial [Salmonella enterica subsp. enterica serovar Senftenberg]|nr:hypothetical protein [Salmonella enterica subsp. enterica serovar Senftenberg]